MLSKQALSSSSSSNIDQLYHCAYIVGTCSKFLSHIASLNMIYCNSLLDFSTSSELSSLFKTAYNTIETLEFHSNSNIYHVVLNLLVVSSYLLNRIYNYNISRETIRSDNYDLYNEVDYSFSLQETGSSSNAPTNCFNVIEDVLHSIHTNKSFELLRNGFMNNNHQFSKFIENFKDSIEKFEEYFEWLSQQNTSNKHISQIGGAVLNKVVRILFINILFHSGYLQVFTDSWMKFTISAEKQSNSKPPLVVSYTWKISEDFRSWVAREKQVKNTSYDNLADVYYIRLRFLLSINPFTCDYVYPFSLDSDSDIEYKQVSIIKKQLDLIKDKLVFYAQDEHTPLLFQRHVLKIYETSAKCREKSFVNLSMLQRLCIKEEFSFLKHVLLFRLPQSIRSSSKLKQYKDDSTYFLQDPFLCSPFQKQASRAGFESFFQIILEELCISNQNCNFIYLIHLLNCFGIRIDDKDHDFLSRIEIFYSLQDIFFSATSKNFASEIENNKVLRAVTKLLFLLSEQVASAPQQFPIDVQSTSTPVLVRSKSGPETLSDVVFDILHSQLEVIVGKCHDENTADVNEANLIFISESLDLIKKVCSTSSCQKVLIKPRWIVIFMKIILYYMHDVSCKSYDILSVLLPKFDSKEIQSNTSDLSIFIVEYFAAQDDIDRTNTIDYNFSISIILVDMCSKYIQYFYGLKDCKPAKNQNLLKLIYSSVYLIQSLSKNSLWSSIISKELRESLLTDHLDLHGEGKSFKDFIKIITSLFIINAKFNKSLNETSELSYFQIDKKIIISIFKLFHHLFKDLDVENGVFVSKTTMNAINIFYDINEFSGISKNEMFQILSFEFHRTFLHLISYQKCTELLYDIFASFEKDNEYLSYFLSTLLKTSITRSKIGNIYDIESIQEYLEYLFDARRNKMFEPKNEPKNEVSKEGCLVNRAGVRISLGTTGLGEDLYYCGRNLGMDMIPDSDGFCGPNNGPQCPDCIGFVAVLPIDAQGHSMRFTEWSPGGHDGTYVTGWICDICRQNKANEHSSVLSGRFCCSICLSDCCVDCHPVWMKRYRSSSSLPDNEDPVMLTNIEHLKQMGFPHSWCVQALQACDNDIEEALSYIIANSDTLEIDATTDSDSKENDAINNNNNNNNNNRVFCENSDGLSSETELYDCIVCSHRSRSHNSNCENCGAEKILTSLSEESPVPFFYDGNYNRVLPVYTEPSLDSEIISSLLPSDNISIVDVKESSDGPKVKWFKIKLVSDFEDVFGEEEEEIDDDDDPPLVNDEDDNDEDEYNIVHTALRYGWVKSHSDTSFLFKYGYSNGLLSSPNDISPTVIRNNSIYKVTANSIKEVRMGTEPFSTVIYNLTLNQVIKAIEEVLETDGIILLHIVEPVDGWVIKTKDLVRITDNLEQDTLLLNENNSIDSKNANAIHATPLESFNLIEDYMETVLLEKPLNNNSNPKDTYSNHNSFLKITGSDNKSSLLGKLSSLNLENVSVLISQNISSYEVFSSRKTLVGLFLLMYNQAKMIENLTAFFQFLLYFLEDHHPEKNSNNLEKLMEQDPKNNSELFTIFLSSILFRKNPLHRNNEFVSDFVINPIDKLYFRLNNISLEKIMGTVLKAIFLTNNHNVYLQSLYVSLKDYIMNQIRNACQSNSPITLQDVDLNLYYDGELEAKSNLHFVEWITSVILSLNDLEKLIDMINIWVIALRGRSVILKDVAFTTLSKALIIADDYIINYQNFSTDQTKKLIDAINSFPLVRLKKILTSGMWQEIEFYPLYTHFLKSLTSLIGDYEYTNQLIGKCSVKCVSENEKNVELHPVSVLYFTSQSCIQLEPTRESQGSWTCEFWICREAMAIAEAETGSNNVNPRTEYLVQSSTSFIKIQTGGRLFNEFIPDCFQASDPVIEKALCLSVGNSVGSEYIFNYAIPSSEWTHIAIVYNSTKNILSLIANGSLVESISFKVFLCLSSIGSNKSESFTGKLAEFRLWSYPRTSLQILRDMNAYVLPMKGLVFLLRCNEKYPSSICDLVGSVKKFNLNSVEILKDESAPELDREICPGYMLTDPEEEADIYGTSPHNLTTVEMTGILNRSFAANLPIVESLYNDKEIINILIKYDNSDSLEKDVLEIEGYLEWSERNIRSKLNGKYFPQSNLLEFEISKNSVVLGDPEKLNWLNNLKFSGLLTNESINGNFEMNYNILKEKILEPGEISFDYNFLSEKIKFDKLLKHVKVIQSIAKPLVLPIKVGRFKKFTDPYDVSLLTTENFDSLPNTFEPFVTFKEENMLEYNENMWINIHVERIETLIILGVGLKSALYDKERANLVIETPCSSSWYFTSDGRIVNDNITIDTTEFREGSLLLIFLFLNIFFFLKT